MSRNITKSFNWNGEASGYFRRKIGPKYFFNAEITQDSLSRSGTTEKSVLPPDQLIVALESLKVQYIY